MAQHLVVSSAGADGYAGDLPLDRDGEREFVLNRAALRDDRVHPMFAARVRIFIDWHLAAGHDVRVRLPADVATTHRLVQLGVTTGLPAGVLTLPAVATQDDPDVLSLTRFSTFHDVEDLADNAVELLQRQTGLFGEWGDAIYMAVGELCENAMTHGKNGLGAYAVADRRTDKSQFRLAIVDLGIGIPEHLREAHPEWQDDNWAVSQALVRGVTGTGDRHRGNGFAEVLEKPLENALIRAASAADLDLRSGKGHLGVQIFGGNPLVTQRPSDPRRGTWITYTITTAG